MMATSLALAFVREKALGVSTGHREILAAIGDFIGAVEPASRARRVDSIRDRFRLEEKH